MWSKIGDFGMPTQERVHERNLGFFESGNPDFPSLFPSSSVGTKKVMSFACPRRSVGTIPEIISTSE
ncbi:MAG: hypothetical protein FVQ83_04115 [Chloroflexi bacterium]|nr:hypothetical protein [Chloroflexota bacterium]